MSLSTHREDTKAATT